MRRAAAAAAAAAAGLLAGCATSAGPGPAEVSASLDAYFTPDAPWKDWPEKLALDEPAMRGARFAPAGGCDAMGVYFVCGGHFTLTDGSARAVNLWIMRREEGWRLMDVVPENVDL